MAKKDITSLRGTLQYLEEENQVKRITKEVDPICEIAAIEKALDGGPALIFENIKGYPGIRDVGNLICTRERISKMFGWEGPRTALENCRKALFNPIPPKIIENAPCQEVVITKDIDLLSMLPVIQHTERDAGRIIGGGNYLITGKYFGGGNEVSFKRTKPLGKNFASVMFVGGTHIWHVVTKHKGEKIPTTINIGTSPAVLIVAGGGGIPAAMPWGGDELGIAGALQSAPVEICKAKTVDAYAIAESEWVIEGYIHATQNVWESEEAEKLGKGRVAPFFPEWPKYFGRARKAWRFEATAITHRKDKPYYYTPLADSFEGDMTYALLREAYFYHLAEALAPGLVQDVNHLYPAFQSLKVQVRKRGAYDDGWIPNLIVNSFAACTGLRLVVFVDEDVDIHNGEDVFWAMATRVDPDRDLFILPGGKGTGMMPVEFADQSSGQILDAGKHFKGIGVDATIPFNLKGSFERAGYPSYKIDLKKWFSEADISAIRASQSDYAKLLAKIGG